MRSGRFVHHRCGAWPIVRTSTICERCPIIHAQPSTGTISASCWLSRGTATCPPRPGRCTSITPPSRAPDRLDRDRTRADALRPPGGRLCTYARRAGGHRTGRGHGNRRPRRQRRRCRSRRSIRRCQDHDRTLAGRPDPCRSVRRIAAHGSGDCHRIVDRDARPQHRATRRRYCAQARTSQGFGTRRPQARRDRLCLLRVAEDDQAMGRRRNHPVDRLRRRQRLHRRISLAGSAFSRTPVQLSIKQRPCPGRRRPEAASGLRFCPATSATSPGACAPSPSVPSCPIATSGC